MDSKMGLKQTGPGLACGVAAGALWGLIFLAPELARGHTPLQLSVGRYLAYGVIAAVLIAPSWRRLRGILTWADWRALAWLGMAGNVLYYALLAAAVQMGGIAMTSLVIGLLPVVVTVIGSRERDAVPLARLMPSVLLSGAGIACIAWQSLAAGAASAFAWADTAALWTSVASAANDDGSAASGILCAFGALASWTAYAVGNSRKLAGLKSITAHEWSLLTGVVTGAQALLLAIPAFLDAPEAEQGWMRFALVMTGVALLCSIAGNALWNRASRLLPLTLTGQLILFETLFALLYGFLWEARWPTGAESAAIALLCASVLSCAAAHRVRSEVVA